MDLKWLEIDNMKNWTDGGLGVTREFDNIKNWTNGRLELAGEIVRRRQRPN